MTELVDDPYRVDVNYRFQFEDGVWANFAVWADLDKDKPATYSAACPDWARLDNHPCDHCPLKKEEHTYCPAAMSLVDIIEFFEGRISYSNCHCEVQLPGKVVSGDKPIQDALYPLMGLRMATSGCPSMHLFRPMARFHEPFSSPYYTVYRMLSCYMLHQHFNASADKQGPIQLEDLKGFYETIGEINQQMALRLKSAKVMDATPNSIMILSLFSTSLTHLFDDFLEILSGLFKPAQT